jgi:Uncharacterized conserved protein
MAGHSKWANIQHRKGKQDARRAKLFTKLIREITVASRMGGADPAGNTRLRAAIDNALSHNMPKDTIERAIKRGAGNMEGENVEEIRYEGYGPRGVAVIVDCMTTIAIAPRARSATPSAGVAAISARMDRLPTFSRRPVSSAIHPGAMKMSSWRRRSCRARRM